MDLSCLDAIELFSLTIWRADGVYTVGVQRRAGDIVQYSKAGKLSEAVKKGLELVRVSAVPALPYA